jgi:hypothetical protein
MRTITKMRCAQSLHRLGCHSMAHWAITHGHQKSTDRIWSSRPDTGHCWHHSMRTQIGHPQLASLTQHAARERAGPTRHLERAGVRFRSHGPPRADARLKSDADELGTTPAFRCRHSPLLVSNERPRLQPTNHLGDARASPRWPAACVGGSRTDGPDSPERCWTHGGCPIHSAAACSGRHARESTLHTHASRRNIHDPEHPARPGCLEERSLAVGGR